MFRTLRELAFARGRFSLMGLAIGLIAILMVLFSGLSAEQLAAGQDQPYVAHAEFMGASIVNAETADGQQVDFTLFGVDPEGFLSPTPAEGHALSDPAGWSPTPADPRVRRPRIQPPGPRALPSGAGARPVR